MRGDGSLPSRRPIRVIPSYRDFAEARLGITLRPSGHASYYAVASALRSAAAVRFGDQARRPPSSKLEAAVEVEFGDACTREEAIVLLLLAAERIDSDGLNMTAIAASDPAGQALGSDSTLPIDALPLRELARLAVMKVANDQFVPPDLLAVFVRACSA